MQFTISNLVEPFEFKSIQITNGVYYFEIGPFELMIFVTLNSIQGSFETDTITF